MSDDLADAVLAKSHLTRAQRARVRNELCAHIDDALAAGKSTDQIRQSLGDPDALAVALELAPPPVPRSRALTAALAASVATLAWYVATAVRLGTFAPQATPNAVLDSTASLARLSLAADSALDRGSTDSALSIASRLASSNSAFAQHAAIRLARRALPMRCDSTDRLAMRLATAPAPDLQAWYRSAVAQSMGTRIGRALRVARAMKGVRAPSLTARVLEPLYFATVSGPADLWRPVIAKAERHTEPSRCAVPLTLDP